MEFYLPTIINTFFIETYGYKLRFSLYFKHSSGVNNKSVESLSIYEYINAKHLKLYLYTYIYQVKQFFIHCILNMVNALVEGFCHNPGMSANRSPVPPPPHTLCIFLVIIDKSNRHQSDAYCSTVSS